MIITHKTCNENLLNIIKDGKIMSSKKTNHVYYGDGIYTSTHYIFYNTMPEYKIKVITPPMIIFDFSVLQDKPFYISKSHTGAIKDREKKYILSSNKILLYNILKKLYTYSSTFKSKKNPELFTIHQEIFTKHELALEKAKYLYISKDFSKINELKKIIKDKYPNLLILYR